MSNKEIFNVNNINLKKLAESYGLIQTPVLNIKEVDQESQIEKFQEPSKEVKKHRKEENKEQTSEQNLKIKKEDKVQK